MGPATSLVERLVRHHLSSLPPAEVGRSTYGVPWFRWRSPCAEIEALWLYVKANEVMLSTKHFHRHFELLPHRCPPLARSKRQRKRAIAREAAREAAAFIRGERAVVLDANAPNQAGCCRISRLAETVAHWKQVAKGPVALTAWAWSGPVPC
jgi:hypothetical protein